MTIPLATLLVLVMSSDFADLESALQSPDPARRREAAETLCRKGPEAGAAALALARACDDADEGVREWAAAALDELGPPRASSVDALVSMVGEANSGAAYWAATLLGRLESEAAPAVPALAVVLAGEGDKAVRQRVAWALGQIGPPAVGAIDALRTAAEGSDPRLARLAKRALGQIDEKR